MRRRLGIWLLGPELRERAAVAAAALDLTPATLDARGRTLHGAFWQGYRASVVAFLEGRRGDA